MSPRECSYPIQRFAALPRRGSVDTLTIESCQALIPARALGCCGGDPSARRHGRRHGRGVSFDEVKRRGGNPMSNRTNRTADDCKACDELERLSVLKDRPSHNAFLHLRLAQQCTCGMCEETGFTAALSAEVSHGRNDMVSLAVHVL